jgi:hypothetical protein
MNHNDMLELLQAFADANGLKMPSAEVLDGIKKESETMSAETIAEIVTDQLNRREQRVRARCYD